MSFHKVVKHVCNVCALCVCRWAPWAADLASMRTNFPMSYPDRDDCIMPQHAIAVGAMGCMYILQPG